MPNRREFIIEQDIFQSSSNSTEEDLPLQSLKIVLLTPQQNRRREHEDFGRQGAPYKEPKELDLVGSTAVIKRVVTLIQVSIMVLVL